MYNDNMSYQNLLFNGVSCNPYVNSVPRFIPYRSTGIPGSGLIPDPIQTSVPPEVEHNSNNYTNRNEPMCQCDSCVKSDVCKYAPEYRMYFENAKVKTLQVKSEEENPFTLSVSCDLYVNQYEERY